MERAEADPLAIEVFAARRFRAALLVAAALLPILFFRAAALAPRTTIPCEVATPGCLNGDPLLVTSVMARASRRWDRGDFVPKDDRVFAPYPDAWALGEPFLLPALVGHPWAWLSGTAAPAYNVPFYLACAFALLSAGALFSRLSGPGLPALLGAALFAWGPARLNNVGVLSVLWAGLVPLVLAFGLDVLNGRRRALVPFAASWLVLGLGSLYGLLMGAIVALVLLPAVALPVPERRTRLLSLAAASAIAALPLLLVYRPFFLLDRDFDARATRELLEGQSGDLLSLLHAGAFTGPVGRLLAQFGPAFPGGTSALFPTLSVLFALGLLAMLRLRPGRDRAAPPERRPWPWVLLGAASLLFALGPTIRLAGHALSPGPWAVLSPLPVFRAMRGLFRWDQWWDLALAALFVLALSRAATALRGRARGAALLAAASLVVLDIWPRPIPSAVVPVASPFTKAIRRLPEDAIVAVHPYTRETATRGTWDEILHGRRLLDSYQTFAPPVHRWLHARASTAPLTESLALYRELGASAVDVDRERLGAADRAAIDALLRAPDGSGVTLAFVAGPRVLLVYPPRRPVLVDPLAASGLVFRNGVATVPGREGRLAFRLRRAAWPVTVTGDAGAGVSAPARLTWDLVGVGGLRARLDPAPPAGAVVRGEGGRLIGRAE
jgi:hypothetical protein